MGKAIPCNLAKVFILFSKTGTFSTEEIELAKQLNDEHPQHVILWLREELEPYWPYERWQERLGKDWNVHGLAGLAYNTARLFFGPPTLPSETPEG